MDEEYNVVFIDELLDGELFQCMEMIKEHNSILYNTLYDNLKNHTVGIRDDVLKYLSENVNQLITGSEYAFHIANLAMNPKVAVGWYAMLNNVVKESPISLDDLMVVINQMVEKGMSLDEAVEILDKEDTDIVKMFELVEKYQNPALLTQEESNEADNKEIKAESKDMGKMEPAEVKEVGQSSEYVALFDDLLTVMSTKGGGSACSVLDIQEHLNRILAKFQVALTEITAYSTDIIREWEKDKDEIKRMKALYAIYQNLMRRQQSKINELQNENLRLQAVIEEAEKKAMNRRELSEKISELQMLADSVGLQEGGSGNGRR